MLRRKFLYPMILFAISWGGYLLTFFWGPISYPYEPLVFIMVLVFSLAYFFGCFFSLLVFPYFTDHAQLRRTTRTVTLEQYFYYCALILCAIYIVVVGLDFIVYGEVMQHGITEYREIKRIQGRRGSLLGFLNVLLCGSPVVLLGVLVLSYGRKYRLMKLAWLVASVGLFSYFLSGGRNQFAISVVILIILISLAKGMRYRVLIKVAFFYKLIAYLFLTSSFMFMLYIFEERAGLRDYDMLQSTFNLKYYFDVEFDAYLLGEVNDFYLMFLNLMFYMNHSMSVLSEYFSDSMYAGVGNGSNVFPLFFMAFDTIAGTSHYKEGVSVLILNGVYLSLPGRVYIDFGWLGVLVVAFLGGWGFTYLVQSLYILNSGGHSGALRAIFCAVLGASVVMSPVYSVLSGFGLSILIALFVVWSLSYFLTKF